MNPSKVKMITNIAEADAMTGGYGKIRMQSGSGQTKFPGGKPHLARDFYLPPLSPIYVPVAGVWDHWAPSNEDGTLGMGWVGVFNGNDGVVYRFIHLAIKDRASYLKGMRIGAGSYLGTTSAHNLGASKSHLHLDTKVRGENVDPLSILGVRGFNIMTHGVENGSIPS